MSRTIERTIKVARWGNSLALRIPREAVEGLTLKAGTVVRIQVSGDSITIRRLKSRRKWTEKEVLEGITPGMCGPDLIAHRKGRELL